MTFVEKSQRVLVTAYDFPPQRTSGVYGPTGLIKYLPGLGWEPTVLTVEPHEDDLVDATLLAKIPPQVTIVRTRTLRLSAWEDRTAKAPQDAGFLQPDWQSSRRSIVNRALRRMASFVRSCVYFPDVYVGWVPFAIWKAGQLNRRNRFDMMYTTGPPRSALIAELVLRVWLDIPWLSSETPGIRPPGPSGGGSSAGCCGWGN